MGDVAERCVAKQVRLDTNVVRAAAASARAQSSMDPVKLIASDGTEIIIDRRAALVSGTIKSMLAGPGASRRHASSCRRLSCARPSGR